MKAKQVKVCGMLEYKNIEEILELSIDYMGFIFYEPSSRNVSDSLASTIANIDFGNTKKIGVFVDEKIKVIVEKIEQFKLDGLQLHGEESPAFCKAFNQNLFISKAISIRTKSDLKQLIPYHEIVDLIVFDTKSDVLKGGTGRKFDWSILQDYEGPTPFLLSGGIQSYDAGIINSFNHPYCLGVDLNSGFEIKPGRKDKKLIMEFKDIFRGSHNL